MQIYIEQFKKIWSEFGPSQKISMLLATALVVIAAGGLFVWSSKPSMQLLYGRMSADDLSDAVNHIESMGVEYRIGAGGSAVYVPSDKVYSLRMDLAAKGVPTGGSVGFEIFDETNFGISDFVQKTNYMRAIQGELSRTIGQLQGVRAARVMVSVPENKILAEQSKIRPTASVFVDTGGGMLQDDAVNSIRYLVANSVEGLKVDDVAVVDAQGNVLSEAVKGEGGFGASSTRLKYKQSLEEYYAGKIESMMNRVLGMNQVVARVSVDIESDAATIVEEMFDPTGQVVRNQTITEDESSSDVAEPRQVAGIVDGGAAGAGGAQSTNSKKDSTKKRSIAYEISRSTKEIVRAPGTVKEISAAVFLATRLDSAGTEKPRSAEELEKIRKMIMNAIGVNDEEGVTQRVTLEEMAFAEPAPVVVPNTFGVPDSLFSLVGQFKNYMAMGLALVMFVMFKGMLKKHKPRQTALEFIESTTVKQIQSAGPSAERSTVDVINSLIQEKPENVSNTLKNWVGSES